MNKDHIYLVAEIGQNHNGSVEIAKTIIDVLAEPVVDQLFDRELERFDAVKLTKRDLTEEMAESVFNKPYTGRNSFGKTYKEHREHLELSDEEHYEVYKYAKSYGFDFVETITSIGAMSILKLFTPDRLKVASRDLTNLPLLEALAETKLPIILSTGMAGPKELDDALNVITKYHDNISILHCLSQYPAQYEYVNLRTITYLLKHYSKYTIGYSDHTVGIAIPLAAAAMGAKIIEKHVTLCRKMRGSDHFGSLAPDGMYRFVRDIRNFEMSLGKEDMFISPVVEKYRYKLERSIASKVEIKKGQVITRDMLQMLSPGDGFKARDMDKIIGKRAKVDIPKNEIIYKDMIE